MASNWLWPRFVRNSQRSRLAFGCQSPTATLPKLPSSSQRAWNNAKCRTEICLQRMRAPTRVGWIHGDAPVCKSVPTSRLWVVEKHRYNPFHLFFCIWTCFELSFLHYFFIFMSVFLSILQSMQIFYIKHWFFHHHQSCIKNLIHHSSSFISLHQTSFLADAGWKRFFPEFIAKWTWGNVFYRRLILNLLCLLIDNDRVEDQFYSSFGNFFQFGISILQGRWVGQNIMEPGITMFFSLSARSSRRLRPHRDMGKPRVTTSDKNSGRLALRQANHAGSWLQSAMTLGQIYLKQIYANSHPILWVDDPYYDMVCLQNWIAKLAAGPSVKLSEANHGLHVLHERPTETSPNTMTHSKVS